MSTLTAIIGTMTHHILRNIVGLKKAFFSKNKFLSYRYSYSSLAFTAIVAALQPPQMIMVLFGVTTKPPSKEITDKVFSRCWIKFLKNM
ncbi:MAG: hypothetical protein QXL96_06870 [Ignisphaera sp.]